MSSSDEREDSAYATRWSGDNVAPSAMHGPSKAVQRENLEDALNDIVETAMRDMKADLSKEQMVANQEEPADEAELLRLRMKYKYKYKYKYSMQKQQADDTSYGSHEWGMDSALQQSQLSSVQAEPAGAEDEGPEYPPMNVILTDDVTLARIREESAIQGKTLDATWRMLAAPGSTANDLHSTASVRAGMEQERQALMPKARALRKLVGRLEELKMVLLEAKEAAIEDARQNARGLGAVGTADQRDAAAEEAGNLRVQAALHENNENEINSQNLMHTSKQYNLINNLRKRLSFASKESSHELYPLSKVALHDDNTALYGDWNKSILVSKKGKSIGSLGKMNKTFKEFRADPWERMRVVKEQDR